MSIIAVNVNDLIDKMFKAFGGLILLVFCLTFQEVRAQYSEEEYDDYIDDYSDHSRDMYSGFGREQSNDRKYKRSRREEELYNGGGHRYSSSGNENRGNPGLSAGSLSGKRNRAEIEAEEYDDDDVKPTRKSWGWFGNSGPQADKRPGEEPSLTGNGDPYQDNRPGEPGGGKDAEGPPPPPDEPDVPVDSAIPLLLAAGIGLAAFRFYSSKKRAINF